MRLIRTSLTAWILAATSAFGAIRAVTPVAWDGNPNCWQLKRHAEKMNVVTNGGAKVVFIGDSITHFWETNGRDQLKKYFSEGDRKMLNLGFSADRTEHVLWRLTEGKELDGYEAKVIFIMIGTNNSGHFPFEKETPIDTIHGIREILRTVRAKQPTAKIVLTAIFPRGEGPDDPCRRRNEAVNRVISEYCDGKDIFWLDFNEQFLTPDGRLPRDVFPDLLHPGPYGYEVWAAAVMPYVDAALSDGKIPMPPNRFASCVRSESFSSVMPASIRPRPTYVIDRDWSKPHWWMDRLLEHRNQVTASNGSFDIVFVGDSITHFWERAGAKELEELRKTYSILNLGYGSDRTGSVLWRLENGGFEGFQTKCFMLMVGTNNREGCDRWSNHRDVVTGIKKIIEKISLKFPQAKIVLLPIFPRGANAQDTVRVRNEKVNAELKGVADGEKIFWVDINAKLVDANGDTKFIMPDRLHPNAEGYRIWKEAVTPLFRRIVGK